MIGHSYLDFIYPDDRASTTQEAARVTEGLATITFQNRYVRKDGGLVWLEWNAVQMPGDPLTYCVARDITQRKSAEEDQAFLAAIIEGSRDAILGVTLDATIRAWNAGAEELYGYPAAEAIGQTMTLIVPPELHEEEAEMLRRAGRGERLEPSESVRIAKDGRRIPVCVTISPIFDPAGRVIGVSKIAQDISARQAAEQEIRKLNRELRQQLRHVSGLREIDQAIASSQELPVTLGMIVNNVAQQLGADAVTLLLLDPHDPEPRVRRHLGLHHAAAGLGGAAQQGLAGEVALEPQSPDRAGPPAHPGLHRPGARC